MGVVTPREATMTIVVPSWTGDVSITVRGWPDFRPVVVSSRTGIPLPSQPTRPPVSFSTPRWTAFMALS